MIIYCEDIGLSLGIQEWVPLGLKDKLGLDSFSISAPQWPFHYYISLQTCILVLSQQDEKYGDQQFLSLHVIVQSSGESLNWLNLKFLWKDFGQATSHC